MGATAANRRVGAETSKTRDVLLDCVERLLLDEGYAGVSYRVVAAKAGVTASLVQYYFPTLDSLFVAMIRRLIERDTARWNDALQRRPDEPLRVLWEYSRSEAAGAMSMEIMALGNHRPAVRAEITEGTERIRRASTSCSGKEIRRHQLSRRQVHTRRHGAVADEHAQIPQPGGRY